MNFTLTHLRLLVNNFKDCFFFYRDVMGFEYRAGDETGPYVEFYAGENIMLGLFERSYMANVVRTTDRHTEPNGQDTVALCFEVANVDELAAKIKQAGIALINEPMNLEQWVLRVAHFRDPAGNLIEINQNLPTT